jgi:hypothetical protein
MAPCLEFALERVTLLPRSRVSKHWRKPWGRLDCSDGEPAVMNRGQPSPSAVGILERLSGIQINGCNPNVPSLIGLL